MKKYIIYNKKYDDLDSNNLVQQIYNEGEVYRNGQGYNRY
jgi:hypothetical protein